MIADSVALDGVDVADEDTIGVEVRAADHKVFGHELRWFRHAGTLRSFRFGNHLLSGPGACLPPKKTSPNRIGLTPGRRAVHEGERETPGGIKHEAVSEEADFLEPPVELGGAGG